MNKDKVPIINESIRKNDKNRNITFSLPLNQSVDDKSNNRLFPMPNSPQVIQPASSSSRNNSSRREKVRLAPHHSALDWERHKHSNNVKDIDPSHFPLRINRDELRKHTSKHDCWMALGGKIYNITSYLDFHPGGVDILLKHAGKDCTAIFMKYHRWVNFEKILDECFIGFLV